MWANSQKTHHPKIHSLYNKSNRSMGYILSALVTVLKDSYSITNPDFPALLSSVLFSSAFDLWKI